MSNSRGSGKDISPVHPGALEEERRTGNVLVVTWLDREADKLAKKGGVFAREREYEVRCANMGMLSTESPRTILVPHDNGRRLVITGLSALSTYEIKIRSRFVRSNEEDGREDVEGDWSKYGPPLKVTMFSYEYGQLVEDHQRAKAYLNGELEPYPEDHERDKKPIAKSMLDTASGTYLNAAKSLWNRRNNGLGAVFLRQEVSGISAALSTVAETAAKKIGLKPQDVIVGSYYMVWETKRKRLLNPDIEAESHKKGAEGLLDENVPPEVESNLRWHLPLANYSYRETPAKVQWVLRNFPYDNTPKRYTLVISRASSSWKAMRPAYALIADAESKRLILAIRGTAELGDAFTDLVYKPKSPFRFHKGTRADVNSPQIGPELQVHSGMYDAANWLVDGHVTNPKVESKVEGCGLGNIIAEFLDDGYKLTITGHSLGAGVGALVALILADRDPFVEIDVYGYGMPACMDETLAEACKGRYRRKYSRGADTALPGLGNRVTIVSVVNKDEIIPRASLYNLELFAADILKYKNRWSALAEKDGRAHGSRAQTLWAPNKRVPIKDARTTDKLAKAVTVYHANPQNLRFVPPGIMMKTYKYRGTDRAVLIDYRFGSLSRFEPAETLLDDHLLDNVVKCFRNLEAGKKANAPPKWQSTVDHEEKGLYVKCTVCNYFVGWQYTGDSEAVEIRATHHCHACGRIVCADCSPMRMSLPEIGILNDVRVCDNCSYKLSFCTVDGDKANNGLDMVNA